MDIDLIVEEYYRKIYKLSLFYVKDVEEAEDMTQEIFYKVMKKSKSFQDRSGVYTWLYRVAVNTILNHLKRKKIVQFLSFNSLPGNEDASDLPDSGQNPADLMEREQQLDLEVNKLEDCIACLSEREKTAFYLFHYEGLKQKEIASILGTSVSAVESLIHKAMRKIRKNMA